jgi:hypothetical protein
MTVVHAGSGKRTHQGHWLRVTCEHTMRSSRRMSLDRSNCWVAMDHVTSGWQVVRMLRISGLQRTQGVVKWRYDNSIKTGLKANNHRKSCIQQEGGTH